MLRVRKYIPLAFTSIDNIRGGRRRRPSYGVDNSGRGYNTCSNDPGYNIGSTVLGSNKPKSSRELSRQHKAPLQALVEPDFS
jgi:hypothetical protein